MPGDGELPRRDGRKGEMSGGWTSSAEAKRLYIKANSILPAGACRAHGRQLCLPFPSGKRDTDKDASCSCGGRWTRTVPRDQLRSTREYPLRDATHAAREREEERERGAERIRQRTHGDHSLRGCAVAKRWSHPFHDLCLVLSGLDGGSSPRQGPGDREKIQESRLVLCPPQREGEPMEDAN